MTTGPNVPGHDVADAAVDDVSQQAEAARPSQGCVLLIHGTFGQHSTWPDSGNLREAIERDASEFTCEPWRWSGGNSHLARIAAANELAQRLDDPEKAPVAAIVAHSHGGNVAVHAVYRVRKQSRPVRIVTLATPFLFAAGRPVLPTLAHLSAFAVVMVLLGAPGAIFVLWAAFQDPLPASVRLIVIGFCLEIFCLSLLFGGVPMVSLWRWWTPKAKAARKLHVPPASTTEVLDDSRDPSAQVGPNEEQAAFIRAVDCPTVTGELLAVRAAGDEASTGLISGQFAGWLGSVVASRGRPVLLVNLLSLVSLVTLTAVAISDTGVPGVLMAAWWLIAAALYLVAALTYILPALGARMFGVDGPALSLFSVVSAESTPPGKVTIYQLPATMHPIDAKPVRVHGLYQDARAIDAIVAYLQGKLLEAA